MSGPPTHSVSMFVEDDQSDDLFFEDTRPEGDWTSPAKDAKSTARTAVSLAARAMGRDASALIARINAGKARFDPMRTDGVVDRWMVDLKAVRSCPWTEAPRVLLREEPAKELIEAVHKAGLWSSITSADAKASVSTTAWISPSGMASVSVQARSSQPGSPSMAIAYPDRGMLLAAMAAALVHVAGSRSRRSGRLEMVCNVKSTGSSTLDAALGAQWMASARHAIATSGLLEAGLSAHTAG